MHFTFRLGLADSELALSETKIRELSGFLSSAKEEQAEVARHHNVELKRAREVRGEGEGPGHVQVIVELYRWLTTRLR